MQQLTPNTLLQGGKYKIIKVLGQSSFNNLYLANQRNSPEYIVIKEFFMKDLAETGKLFNIYKQKFVRTGQLLSKLNHKYIVKCIDIFEENNTAYYVTEFSKGENLRNYHQATTTINCVTRMSEQRSITIIKLIAEALYYLHQNGICHCDVKPSNIMFFHNEHYEGYYQTKPDSITLLDFAIAFCFNSDKKFKDFEFSSQHGMGTLGYAPLELSSHNNKLSPATDIYSLGATWYFLLTGQRPPQAAEILNEGLEPIFGVSDRINNAIHAAMNPIARNRPQSIPEFLSLFGESLSSICNNDIEETVSLDVEVQDDEEFPVLPIGTELKGPSYNYTIRKVLGNGSFGITYLATVKLKGSLGMLNSEIKVTIKEFFMKDYYDRKKSGEVTGMESSENSLLKKYRNKFLSESINLSHLTHNNIVKVVESFEANGTAYYVMEYIDGGNLDEYVAKQCGMNEQEALKAIRQIGSALSYMHQHRMLHLDLKPKNVMRKTDGTCVLIDFGLSKQYDHSGNPETSTSLGGGTAGYAPLEQVNYTGEKEFAPTLDVYALGATLYKMLTAKTPAPASVILNDGFDRKELECRNISNDTIDVITMAMEPIKRKRMQSVEEFLTLLPDEETVKSRKKTYRRNVSEETAPVYDRHNSSHRDIEEVNGIPVRWRHSVSEYQKKVIRRLLSRMTRLTDGRYALINDFVSMEELHAVTSSGTRPVPSIYSKTAYEKVSGILTFLKQLTAMTQTAGGFTLMDVGHFINNEYTFADEKEDILLAAKDIPLSQLIDDGSSKLLQKCNGYKWKFDPLSPDELNSEQFRFKIMIDSHLFYWMYKNPDET